MDKLKNLIRNVPDFPKKGIGFKDITTLVKDGKAFQNAIDYIANNYNPEKIDLIVGIEARGFIFASALAYKWGKGVILVRKPGKLPAETVQEEYALEYGTDKIEIHKDAIAPDQRILIVDDLLATGGTIAATCRLIEKLDGKIVGIAFLIELGFLKGIDKIRKYNCFSLIKF